MSGPKYALAFGNLFKELLEKAIAFEMRGGREVPEVATADIASAGEAILRMTYKPGTHFERGGSPELLEWVIETNVLYQCPACSRTYDKTCNLCHGFLWMGPERARDLKERSASWARYLDDDDSGDDE